MKLRLKMLSIIMLGVASLVGLSFSSVQIARAAVDGTDTSFEEKIQEAGDSTKHVSITKDSSKELVLEDGCTYDFEKDVTISVDDVCKGAMVVKPGAKVFINIKKGVTVKAEAKIVGAGIYVPKDSVLIIKGEGRLIAQGGDTKIKGKEEIDGAGAGIGGHGGEAGNDGAACGTVCIMDEVNVKAISGLTDDGLNILGKKYKIFYSKYDTLPCFGIGGGGAGWIKGEKRAKRRGFSGNIFIDKNNNKVIGRPGYFYSTVLSQSLNQVVANGMVSLEFGDESDNSEDGINYVVDEFFGSKLLLALTEAQSHDALSKYTIAKPPVKTKFSDSFCNGAAKYYVEGSDHENWYKELHDNSGGYIYHIAECLAKDTKSDFNALCESRKEEANPYNFIESEYDKIMKLSRVFSLSDKEKEAQKKLLHSIFFYEHYCEPEGGRREAPGYTRDNVTKGTHSTKDGGLKPLHYTYMTVYDTSTARDVTMSYNTRRTWVNNPPADGGTGSTWKVWEYDLHLYYEFSSTLQVTHNKRDILAKNWMKYMPDDMPISEANIPGSHDAGAFNMKFDAGKCGIFKDELTDSDKEFLKSLMTKESVLDIFKKGIKTIPDRFDGGRIIEQVGAATFGPGVTHKAQIHDITTQLNKGTRMLDIRLDVGTDNYVGIGEYTKELSGNRELVVAHGHGGIAFNSDSKKVLTVDNVIKECYDFLEKNPSEFILLMYQGENDESKKEWQEKIKKMEESFSDKFDSNSKKTKKILWVGRDDINDENEVRIPTVKECRGSIVLFSSDLIKKWEDNYSVPASEKESLLKKVFDKAQKQKIKGDFKITKNSDNPNPKVIFASTYLADTVSYVGEITSGADILNYAIAFFSGSGGKVPNPVLAGNQVNKWLQSKYVFDEGKNYGWIFLNSTDNSTNKLIYETNIADIGKIWKNKHDDSNDEDEPKIVASVFSDGNFVILLVFPIVIIGVIIIFLRKRKKN